MDQTYIVQKCGNSGHVRIPVSKARPGDKVTVVFPGKQSERSDLSKNHDPNLKKKVQELERQLKNFDVSAPQNSSVNKSLIDKVNTMQDEINELSDRIETLEKFAPADQL